MQKSASLFKGADCNDRRPTTQPGPAALSNDDVINEHKDVV